MVVLFDHKSERNFCFHAILKSLNLSKKRMFKFLYKNIDKISCKSFCWVQALQPAKLLIYTWSCQPPEVSTEF